MILSGGRLPVTLQAMESENQCEMAYITDLPECVWQMIGLVLSLRPVSFGSAAVAGFDICIVFLDAVRCGKKPLWRLCVDCDECKLQAFLQGLVFCRGRFISSVASSTCRKSSCTCFVISSGAEFPQNNGIQQQAL